MASSGAYRRRQLPLTLAIGMLLASPAPAAHAQSADDAARQHFERGYEAAQKGSFEQAIEEFKLAYAASPNFSVLFNLGQAYGAAGRPVQAARTLARYLTIGGAAVDAEQRRTAQELIAYYRRRIGSIRIGALPAGALVALDGEELGSAPFGEPIEAAAGRHALTVRAVGYQPFVASFDVSAGQITSVDPALRAEGKPTSAVGCTVPCAPARELERAQHTRAKAQKLVAISLGSAAILTGGAALTIALINDSRYREWQKKSNAFTLAFQENPSSTRPEQLEQLLQDETSIRNRDAVAIGLGVGAGMLAVGSVVLYLTAGSSSHVPSIAIGPRGAWSADFRSSF